MATIVRVKGYREFLRAIQNADKETKKAVRQELKKAGEEIRRDADRRFSRYSAVSAAGYRVRVRQRGIVIEQSLRKTTGKNPAWGALQMTEALLPARSVGAQGFETALEQALDRICDRVG